MKRQRVSGFVVVLVLIFPGKIFSQQVSPRIAQISPHESHVFCCSFSKTSSGYFNNLIDQGNFTGLKMPLIFQVPDATTGAYPLMAQPFAYSNYYHSHLGYFCQKEYQFEKNTSVPLRFRLGSLEYVDRMEGKK